VTATLSANERVDEAAEPLGADEFAHRHLAAPLQPEQRQAEDRERVDGHEPERGC